MFHRDGFITRDELAFRWRCSIGRLRHLERKRSLTHVAHCSSPGTPHYYDEKDILQLETTSVHYAKHANRASLRSEITQRRAFIMFEEGRDLAYVTRILKLSIEVVDALYANYKESNLERRYRKNVIAKAAEIPDDDDEDDDE